VKAETQIFLAQSSTVCDVMKNFGGALRTVARGGSSREKKPEPLAIAPAVFRKRPNRLARSSTKPVPARGRTPA
jgi:hypothetical protein